MLKHLSERVYEVFRVDGEKNNSQIPEDLTVATTIDVSGESVDADNPLPVDQSSTDELHETAVYLKESIDDLLIEQRLTNEYLSHILGEDLRECEE
jgi:hypothetical protein